MAKTTKDLLEFWEDQMKLSHTSSNYFFRKSPSHYHMMLLVMHAFKYKENLTVEELKNSKRVYKSATPKYTIDWWLKWVASIFILSALSMRGIDGFVFYDLILSIFGIGLWLIVSVLWRDRALILLNGVGLLFLLRNLFEVMNNV